MKSLIPHRPRACFHLAVSCLLAACSGLAVAGPPLDEQGRAGFAEYLRAPPHRAFALAPGGAWAWRGDLPSVDLALQAALEDCQSRAGRSCLPYAVDGKVILTTREWAAAWRPYASGPQVQGALEGLRPGQRFPDLAYVDPAGQLRRLSDWRGRVVVVHFWGSWCPPCQREMPDLEKLYQRFRRRGDIHFLLLPVREEKGRARDWARQRGLTLPIAEGVSTAQNQGEFRLVDGRRLRDRDLAQVFPTSYVLDRHGLVLFAHQGPVADWLALAPLMEDAAAGAGR